VTGPVPNLVLSDAAAARIVYGEGDDDLPIGWQWKPPRFVAEVEDWCLENMRSSVLLLFGQNSLRYEVSFGHATDHVLFKLRWV
jgi:hypothetical protein